MMDKDYLYQIDIREWIERGLDADIMVPVSGNKIDKKYDIYLQSFLLPLNEVENDMENDTYNAHTLVPGITVYGSWEDDEKVYHRWGNDNGYEPLVIKREYNGVATDSIEIVEEFRLLFNLYFNSQKNEYIDVSNGEGITVVKMNDNGYVTIHKRYLKTYLAVKEKVLMIHIDSRCVSIDNSEKIKEDGLAYRNSENFHLQLVRKVRMQDLLQNLQDLRLILRVSHRQKKKESSIYSMMMNIMMTNTTMMNTMQNMMTSIMMMNMIQSQRLIQKNLKK